MLEKLFNAMFGKQSTLRKKYTVPSNHRLHPDQQREIIAKAEAKRERRRKRGW